MFDSHVRRLLDASVGLVNGLTGDYAHGRPYPLPTGCAAARAVRDALDLDGPDPGGSDVDLLVDTAHRLRRAFTAVSAGAVDEAATTVNELLVDTGARPRLDLIPGEPWQLHFHGREDGLGVGWSAGCAVGMALAIGSDLAGRLGVCGAPRCDRVYVDTSRNAGRQFCSTACQNRVKAAAFRARRTTDE